MGNRQTSPPSDAGQTVGYADSRDECPVKHNSGPVGAGGVDACPVKHDGASAAAFNQPLDPSNNMPSSGNNLPLDPSQHKTLSIERASSHILKGTTAGGDGTTWTYPSPQMFYNALARKGKLGDTSEDDMDIIVGLHNNMNETTWTRVLEWEAAANPDAPAPPVLSRFMGRPTDLSPKAMFKHRILGHPLPYDRHDWTVVRHDGTERRYVIDYYHDESRASEEEGSGLPAMEDTEAVKSLLVDVRPAFDGIGSAVERAAMPLRRAAGTSSFVPLPMMPDAALKEQVAESVEVWRGIQEGNKSAPPLAREKIREEAEPAPASRSSPTGEADARTETQGRDGAGGPPKISRAEADALSKELRRISETCGEAMMAQRGCDGEAECEQATVGLTMCLASILCPAQHAAVVEALDRGEKEALVDHAFGEVTACVNAVNGRAESAVRLHPEAFKENFGDDD